jgi:hypothetical protein
MSSTTNKRFAAEEPLERARQAAADALEKAKEAVECVAAAAGHTVSAVGKKADDLTSAAGAEIKHAGDVMDKKGPQGGLSGSASHAVAGTLQGSGKYIEHAKLSGMAHDVAEVVKNHPVPTMLICFGLGYCVARALNSGQ